jgi:2-polyprenyl-3-methyl-5-hydroxy-6-metoxy-1,4-benzoquinol methylase
MSAMRTGRFEEYLGVDISDTSVGLTRSILRSRLFGDFKNYEIRQGDFLSLNLERSTRFDFLVMSEVLEHLEQPERFLAKLREYAAPQAHIFITTCINAPAVDHIYLYTSQDHVRGQVRDVGLSIERELWLPYVGLSLDESLDRKLPVNLAMVLSCPS